MPVRAAKLPDKIRKRFAKTRHQIAGDDEYWSAVAKKNPKVVPARLSSAKKAVSNNVYAVLGEETKLSKGIETAARAISCQPIPTENTVLSGATEGMVFFQRKRRKA